jgi:hypothetical protein
MGKVGRFVTDSKAGAYCRVTLESGEKILVNHDRGETARGSLVIQEIRWWGLAVGDTLLRCDLERNDGQQLLARLIRTPPPTSGRATAIGALVDYVKDCRSVSEVRAKCAALMSTEPLPAA